MTSSRAPARPLPTLVGCLVVLLGGCATTGVEYGAPTPAVEHIDDPPARSGAPTVLIAMPGSSIFVDVRKSLVSEVQKRFNIHTFVVARTQPATCQFYTALGLSAGGTTRGAPRPRPHE